MQNQIGKRAILAVLVAFILFGSIESSFAVSKAINSGIFDMLKQWPIAVWYGLSVVLAVIGYMKAKSKG